MWQLLHKNNKSPFRIIILGFLLVILAGSFLLMLPISTKDRVVTPFLDALFTSTSAVCVTGLVIYDTATYWSGFGQLVIILLIQIGEVFPVLLPFAQCIFFKELVGTDNQHRSSGFETDTSFDTDNRIEQHGCTPAFRKHPGVQCQPASAKTGETYSDAALHDPDVSVQYGTLFYSLLLEEFGNDPKTAAAAYHAGRGQVNRWLQNPEYSENGVTLDVIPTKDTNHYVHKVLKAMDIYSNLYEKELAEDV